LGMKEQLIVVLVGLFIVVLILRAVRGLASRRVRAEDSGVPEFADAALVELIDQSKAPGKAREILREMGRRVSGLESPRLRAAYICARGNLSLNQLKRPKLAVGFYLRALREDPACEEALKRLQELLTAQRRVRRLEWMYWDVLGRLDDIDADSKVWFRCWSGLASLYSASPRKVRRADAIRKVLSAYAPEDMADTGEFPKIHKLGR
jgi:hypothetical protein